MGFTIEDMMVEAQERYRMKWIAGEQGWSNSISWLLMVEDLTIIRNFTGKEIAVTTGLGFPTEEQQLRLAEMLVQHHASGLIINTGAYIKEIPDSVLKYCNENDLPLLTVPWDVYLADMIKDLSIRVFLQGSTDEQISSALIQAIQTPEAGSQYLKELRPYLDVDGTFQVVLITNGALDSMDTVDRKRISYRMQLYLTNLTHNGHFFYYDSYFVLVVNALRTDQLERIVRDFEQRLRKRMPEQTIYLGVSSQVTDIHQLKVAYDRASAAVRMAMDQEKRLVFFSEMGTYRILYSLQDKGLLTEICEEPLRPLLDYDQQHHSNYVETLEQYLKCDGSIQAVSAAMYTHRNTIMYRMNNIRKLLGTELSSSEERLPYQIACMVRHMKH